VLMTDERGLPLSYTAVPANEKEYEPLSDLLLGVPADIVIADKGFWGGSYNERVLSQWVKLLTRAKVRTPKSTGR
jgi:hypothetical protein